VVIQSRASMYRVSGASTRCPHNTGTRGNVVLVAADARPRLTRYLTEGFGLRRFVVVAQPEVQRQVRPRPPVILNVETGERVRAIQARIASELRELEGHAGEELRQIRERVGAARVGIEEAVRSKHLHVCAELDRMIAGAAATPNHREVVHHLKQRLASTLWER